MKRGRNQRRRQNGANPNRALDSNGPDVRIRGTAMQIYDKYQALARDASSAGDRVKAENYLQHAEHYFRLIKSMQPTQNQETSDANAPQPVVDEARNEERRANSEAKPEEAVVESPSKEATAAEASEEAPAAEASAEEKKPRRRRTRRTVKKAADDDAGDQPKEAIAS